MREIYSYYDGKCCPVNDFLIMSDKKIQKKFLFCLDYVKDEKNVFCEPVVKHFSLEKYRMLYQLRIKAARTMVRIIFYEHNGDIYLLHAFYKKDNKTTQRALEAALRIWEKICDKEGNINEESVRKI